MVEFFRNCSNGLSIRFVLLCEVMQVLVELLLSRSFAQEESLQVSVGFLVTSHCTELSTDERVLVNQGSVNILETALGSQRGLSESSESSFFFTAELFSRDVFLKCFEIEGNNLVDFSEFLSSKIVLLGEICKGLGRVLVERCSQNCEACNFFPTMGLRLE